MRLGFFVKAMLWRLGACSVAFGYVFAVACLGQMLLRVDCHEPMWVWWAACTAAVLVLTIIAHRLFRRGAVSWEPNHALIAVDIGVRRPISCAVRGDHQRAYDRVLAT